MKFCANKVTMKALHGDKSEWTYNNAMVNWLPGDDDDLPAWSGLKSGVAAFYDNLQHALPYLLAYRY